MPRRGLNEAPAGLFLCSLLILLAGCFAGISLDIAQRPESGSGAAPADHFPNLIENGDFEAYNPALEKETWRLEPEGFFLWDLFSRPGGKRALFIAASLVAPLKEARLACRLKSVTPQTSYLFEGFFIRNRNIDGVYPTISLFGRDRRLSDFWASGTWQKLSLVFPSPPAKKAGEPAPAFLEIRIPRDDYVLWMDNLSLREIKALPVSPAEGGRLNRDTIEFTWEMTPTDRLFEIVLVLSRDRDFAGPGLLRFPTNNAGDGDEGSSGTLIVPNHLARGKWFWRLEIFQHKTLLAVSSPRHFFIMKEYPGDMPDGSGVKAKKGLREKEFFPLGIIGVPIEDFKELAEIGFNAVTPLSTTYESLAPVLAAAAVNHLKLLLSADAASQNLLNSAIGLAASPRWSRPGPCFVGNRLGLVSGG